jgi:hypothetical protein
MVGMLFLGMVGMLTEVVYTSVVKAKRDKDYSMMGHVSLWMFPIYALGLTYGFDFIHSIIEHPIIRWLSYPLWIWAVELVVGIPTKRMGLRIWSYDYLPDRYHWRGIISFVHAPLWIGFGIFIEIVKGLM